ncbi:glutamate-rich protein 3 isoform X2 [Patella vulgata]|uniref:glutamate-rich protein 3 isoform X2 n=1 Tax=Patella vulgata TaxID=6465 RepID=UPI0024A9D6B4|nr:glutamate-rich protein 3 isoform X2 [Patella vulgata]
MSHLMTETEKGPGPLANYNSLTDGHLTGYFANARKRKHLRKVGLISRSGHLVSENTYRINTARKEHRKHIKNLLAQAIVEKTLDLERHRQNIIKQKLEEIAKMELVQRVREEEKERPVTKWSSRPNSAIPTSTQKVKLLPRAQSASEKRPNEEDILPFLSPRSPRRPISGPAATKSVGSPKGKYRPISAPQRKRPESGSTKTSTNYDDEDEEDVEYLDISPRRNGENRNDNGVDFKQLYSLNAAALRKYAMTLAKIEQGRGGMSPYNITTQVPLPPKSPRREHNTSARSRRYKDGGLSDRSPTRRTASGQAYLHQMDSITVHPGQLQSMVEVTMRYHGWKLSLARDELDPRNQVIIEQQHCGGNTLTVFKEKLLPKSDFTFVSHRHRGYPFSLTIYVDGRMDSRVSTCCEYRHAKHVRLGGPNGHFSIVSVTGNMPCYKCQVQRGGKKKKKKQPSAQPEDGTEEIILEAHQTPETEVQMQNSVEEGNQEQILVPVENDIVEVKPIEEACENYDDDFEDSDVEKDKKDESKENVEEEEELDNREIRGLSLESPRDSLNDTPVTVLEKDEEVLLNGRKIDAYSSEEEDLDGPVSKVVIVETDEEDQEAPRQQIRQTSQEKICKKTEKGQPKKTVPVKPQKAGKSPQNIHSSKTVTPPASPVDSQEIKRSKETTPPPPVESSAETYSTEDSESESPVNSTLQELSPKRNEIVTKSTPTVIQKRSESVENSPTNEKESSSSSPILVSNQSSPIKTPEIIHTVWTDEETESSQSPISDSEHEDMGNKRGKIANKIIEEFGKPDGASTYEADDEGTERSSDQLKNQRVASEIIRSFGKDQEDAEQSKNQRISGEIIKTFGTNQDEIQKDKRVAEEILEQFGQKESSGSSDKRVAEAILKEFGEKDPESQNVPEGNKDQRIAEEMLKQFGQKDSGSENRSEGKKDQRVAEEMLKQFGDKESEGSKDQRVAEEMLKQFGQKDPEGNNDKRVAQEILREFGGKKTDGRVDEEMLKELEKNESEGSKNQRVAEEMLKQFGQNDSQTYNLNKESIQIEKEQTPVVKESASMVSRSPADNTSSLNPDTNQKKISPGSDTSIDSTEKEILQKKRDSQEFFKPALEKKQMSLSDSSSSSGSDSDSETTSGSSTDSETDVETTQTKSSSVADEKPTLTPEPSNITSGPSSTTPQQSSVAQHTSVIEPSTNITDSGEQKATSKTNAVSEDSSSDSDTDSDSDDSSSSDSVSSTSGSDNESEVKKTGDTQTDETKPEVNEQSVENDKKEKDAVNPEESANKEKRSPPKDDTVASTENQNGDTTTTAEEKQVNGKGKTKSVRFRNTPEPMENRVSNGHAETEENDDGEDEEPTVRTFLSKSGVAPNKIHAGSIKHLLDDSNDIQLDGIYLEKHQIEEICDIVKEREDLKTLSLHNAGLKDEDLNKISDALICSPSEPVMLNFMLNELTSKSMEFLVEVMRAEPTLDILLLQGNEIGDEGVRILADGIVDIHLDARQRRKNSLIRQSSELQVVQIHAHQDGSVPQAPPQRRNSSLFDPARNARFCRLGELDLGDTGLTDDGMEHVARMLEQNVYLETLSLSSNIEIGKRGWLRLSKALEKNRRLQTLTLDFNNIGDDGITLLCRGLKDNRTINAIDLEETGIGERGGRMLLELLKRNTTILDMTLTPGNNIPESILNEIKRYLLLNQAADGY